MAKRALTDDREAEITALYEAGEPSGRLAARFKTTQTVILHALKRQGIVCRKCSRRCTLNEGAFDDAELKPDAAYYLGLLFADGCVSHRLPPKGDYFSLTQSGEGLFLVEGLRTFLGSSHAITTLNYESNFTNAQPRKMLMIKSTRLVEVLARYGVVPQKSMTADPPESMLDNRDWMRGLVDGDGWLYVSSSNQPNIGVTGSFRTCQAFLAFARKLVTTRASIHPNGNIWSINLTCTPAYRVVKRLYENCCVALPRKLALAARILLDFARFDR